MSKVVTGMMFLVISILPWTPSVTAQESDCGEIDFTCGAKHVFFEDVEGDSKPEPLYFHGNCLYCYQGGEMVAAEICHEEGCSGSGDEQLLCSKLIGEASSGDVPGLLFLAATMPGRIHVNPGRRALQILSCRNRGIVIANVPLEGFYDLAVALLPGAGRSVGDSDS